MTATKTIPPIPRHVAVIMDGNGRWAKQHHLPRLEGHRRGVTAVRETLEAALEAGVEYVTLYAFSVENWRRPKTEVAGLMALLAFTLRNQLKELKKNGIRLHAIGRLNDLPEGVRKPLTAVIEQTKNNRRLNLVLALSYSGRVELVEAMRQLAEQVRAGNLQPKDMDEAQVQRHLYTAMLPDPDLLIRTSGEMRLSNFLLWQMSYTEIYVTPVFWPDFRKKDFMQAIEDYQRRHRRFGGVA